MLFTVFQESAHTSLDMKTITILDWYSSENYLIYTHIYLYTERIMAKYRFDEHSLLSVYSLDFHNCLKFQRKNKKKDFSGSEPQRNSLLVHGVETIFIFKKN